jgi:hypothetical protein
MTKLENYGVTELDATEYQTVEGGSDWSYAVGYTTELMIFHMETAIDVAQQYYIGK